MLVFKERTYENFDISTNNEISFKAPKYYGNIMGKWLSHLNAR
jgi:hypothetical protein